MATDPVIDLFEHLLRVNSPSGQEEEMAAHLLGLLAGLGLPAEIDPAGNVLAGAPGEGEPLLLCAHMDTVEPTPGLRIVRQAGVIRSDGATILGADDKAGIAVVLEAVRRARRRPPLDLVFTVREETGLVGAKRLDLARLRARRGYVFDSGGPIGSVVVGAPSQAKLAARVLGKAAHAGVCPEQGVSAIVVAAHAITRMPLGRIDEETTANVGVIRGGAATNIVCDAIEMRMEARSHSEAKLADQVVAMRTALETAATEAGARVVIEEERSYRAFRIADDHPLVVAAMQTALELGHEGAIHVGGGGSDANVLNAAGVTCVNLSVGMEASHCKDEYIPEQGLADAASFATALLERLAG